MSDFFFESCRVCLDLLGNVLVWGVTISLMLVIITALVFWIAWGINWIFDHFL